MTTNYIYLHGLGSSPSSLKARHFATRLAAWGIDLRIPDLNGVNFGSLTLSWMIDRVRDEVRACPLGPVSIIASSFGAAAAVHFVEKYRGADAARIDRMLLLAPSFDFMEGRRRRLGTAGIEEWRKRGHLPYFHEDYNRTVDLSYDIVTDMGRYDAFAAHLTIPTLVIHGRHDQVVDYRQSVRFAASQESVQLLLVDSGHGMVEQGDFLWGVAAQHFRLCQASGSPGIAIEMVDCGTAEGRSRFARYRERFFGILEAAYGDRFIPTTIHMRRIEAEGRLVFLAFAGPPEPTNIVAGAFISPSGKRSATAVAEHYRGRGIARHLICASFGVCPRQFTEISVDDDRMQGLLKSVGFQQVFTEARVRNYLNGYEPLLKEITWRGEDLVVTRESSSRPGLIHHFLVLERVPLADIPSVR